MALHDHEVAETAAHHRRRGVLEGPLARREDQILRAVLSRGFGVGALAGRDGVEDVSLGKDAYAGVFGVDDDGGANFSGRHHAGGLPECVRGADHENLLGHSVCHLHGASPPGDYRAMFRAPTLVAFVQLGDARSKLVNL
jgi:hypothetical protein